MLLIHRLTRRDRVEFTYYINILNTFIKNVSGMYVRKPALLSHVFNWIFQTRGQAGSQRWSRVFVDAMLKVNDS